MSSIAPFTDEPTTAPGLDACPECNSTTPWGAGSWCPDCGYYPTAGDFQLVQKLSTAEDSEEEEETKRESLVPGWLKLLLGGCLALIGFNVATRLYFHYSDGNLGFVAMLELILGMVCLLAAQCWAAVFAMRENDRITLVDAFAGPIDVWAETIRDLPRGQWRLSLGVWGLTGVICCFVILGGFSIDGLFRVEKQEPETDIVKVVGQIAIGEKKKEKPESEDLEEYAKQANVDELGLLLPNRGPSYTIYGYMRDGRNTPNRLLLEANSQHIAVVMMDSLPESMQTKLASLLLESAASETDVNTPFSARWVRPEVRLPIESDGKDSQGRLKNARLVEGTTFSIVGRRTAPIESDDASDENGAASDENGPTTGDADVDQPDLDPLNDALTN